MDRFRQSQHYDTFLGFGVAAAGVFCVLCFIVGLAVSLAWLAEVVR